MTISIKQFVARVNTRAEADMLAGNPITGAHHRALQVELALLDSQPVVSETPAPALHKFNPKLPSFGCVACNTEGHSKNHPAPARAGEAETLPESVTVTLDPQGREVDRKTEWHTGDSERQDDLVRHQLACDAWAAEVTALRQHLAEMTKERDALKRKSTVDDIAFASANKFTVEAEAQVATLTQEKARQALTIAARQADWALMRNRLALLSAGVQQIEQEMRDRMASKLPIESVLDRLHALTEALKP